MSAVNLLGARQPAPAPSWMRKCCGFCDFYQNERKDGDNTEGKCGAILKSGQGSLLPGGELRRGTDGTDCTMYERRKLRLME